MGFEVKINDEQRFFESLPNGNEAKVKVVASDANGVKTVTHIDFPPTSHVLVEITRNQTATEKERSSIPKQDVTKSGEEN